MHNVVGFKFGNSFCFPSAVGPETLFPTKISHIEKRLNLEDIVCLKNVTSSLLHTFAFNTFIKNGGLQKNNEEVFQNNFLKTFIKNDKLADTIMLKNHLIALDLDLNLSLSKTDIISASTIVRDKGSESLIKISNAILNTSNEKPLLITFDENSKITICEGDYDSLILQSGDKQSILCTFTE
jgi:hypothetical protein